MLLAALLTAVIGVSAAVAVLLPVSVLVSVRIGLSQSRLFIPIGLFPRR